MCKKCVKIIFLSEEIWIYIGFGKFRITEEKILYLKYIFVEAES